MTVTDEHRARRAEWVRLLRTEDLRQTRTVLCQVVDPADGAPDNGLGYCCLGVAELSVGNRPVRTLTHRWSMNGMVGVMSEQTMRLLGFDEDNPLLAVEPEFVQNHENRRRARVVRLTLAELNDDLGLSLAEIADVIEAQPDDWTGVYQR